MRSSVRYYILSAIFSILICAPATLLAQMDRSDDFTLKYEVKHATCEKNGSITFTVKNKRDPQPPYEYTIKSYEVTYPDGKTVPTTGSEHNNLTNTNTISNLGKGSYSVKVVIDITGENQVTLEKKDIKVESNFIPQNPVAQVIRKPLKDYKQKGKAKYTGIIGINSNVPKEQYIVEFANYPSTYTGKKEFIFGGNKALDASFYEMPPGQYTFRVSDGCDTRELKINLEEVKDNYEGISFSSNNSSSLKEKVGGIESYWIKGSISSNDDDLKPYIEPDTIYKYFQFSALSPMDINNNMKLIMYDFPKSNNPETGGANIKAIKNDSRISFNYKFNDEFKKLPVPRTLDNKGQEYQNVWPFYYLKLKGTDDKPHKYELERNAEFKINAILFSRECKDKKVLEIIPQLYTNIFYYTPVKIDLYRITKDNKKEKINLKQNEINKRNGHIIYDLKPEDQGCTFKIIADDGFQRAEFKSESIDRFTKLPSSYSRKNTYCIDKPFYSKGFHVSLNNGLKDAGTFKGFKFKLTEAPQEYLDQIKSDDKRAKIGQVYTIEKDDHIFHPLGTMDEKNEQIEIIFKEPGNYKFKFELTDPCGGHDEIPYNLPVSYIKYKPTKFTPKVEPVCEGIRIYPFYGLKESFILWNGKDPSDKMAMIIWSLPENTEVKSLKTNMTSDGKLEGKYPKVVSNVSDADKNYIQLPKGKGTIVLYPYPANQNVYSLSNFSDNCIDPIKINIDDYLLSYDRDRYFAYSCLDRKSGEMRICPTNSVGDVTLQLYSEDPKKGGKLLKKTTREKGDCEVFELGNFLKDTGGKVQDQYYLEITDNACNNVFFDYMTVYNLSPNMIKINQKGLGQNFCEGDKIVLSADNIGNDAVYEWKIPGKKEWQEGREITIDHADPKIHSGQYLLRIKNVVCNKSTYEEIAFDVSVSPTEIWWKKDAVDADWNNPQNWALKDGSNANSVPSHCSNVHIPAVVDKYFPNLFSTSTHDTYGDPTCNDIYFHFGSKIGAPHFLNYKRAFVDYNFGYYSSESTNPQPLVVPKHEGANDRLMARDRYYMLSTPLKGVYTGDFDMAGYPYTYYSTNDYKRGEVGSLKLSKPLPDLNIQLSSKKKGIHDREYKTTDSLCNYGLNAFIYKVPSRKEGIGFKDQKNLDLLKGIIQLPYYEDSEKSKAYPLQKYFKEQNKSIVYYYYYKTLLPTNEYTTLYRDEKNYRFVFETDNNEIKQSYVGKSMVRNYSISIKGNQIRGGQWILIGNPYMSDIDFDKFIESNDGRFEKYYYIFTGNQWKGYCPDNPSENKLTKNIPPLQSFVVRMAAGGSSFYISFPMEGDYNILVNPDKDLHPKSTNQAATDKQPIKLTICNDKDDYTYDAYISDNKNHMSMPALIADEYDYLPVVYIRSDHGNGEANMFEASSHFEDTYHIGVHSSVMGNLKLRFDRLKENGCDKAILWDKYEDRYINLGMQPEYSFWHNPKDSGEGTRFELIINKDGNALNHNQLTSNKVSVIKDPLASSVKVQSEKPIVKVDVYSFAGEPVHSDRYEGRQLINIPISVGGNYIIKLMFDDQTTQSIKLNI